MIGGRYFGLGIASLILIFSALCLTAVSLLSLFSATKEMYLTQKYKTSVENYYAADTMAVDISLELIEAIKNGNFPTNVNGIPIYCNENGIYSFSCPIDKTRIIAVRIRSDSNSFKILSWQEKDIQVWSPNEYFSVWEGDEIK